MKCAKGARMLLINTHIQPSEIHGLGLFAAEDIPKGTWIWKFHSNTTQVFSQRKFLSVCQELSFHALKNFIDYSYIRKGKIYYINDNTRFINHSTTPNVGFLSNLSEIALQDIKKGDEIIENYHNSYDENDFFRMDIDLKITDQIQLFNQLRLHLDSPVILNMAI
jgi:uncharacterized protein